MQFKNDQSLIALLLVFMVAMTMVFAGSAAAQEADSGEVILLDEDGDEVDTYDGTTPLEEALDDASSGYTILVGAGCYERTSYPPHYQIKFDNGVLRTLESVDIIGDVGIHITSDGSGSTVEGFYIYPDTYTCDSGVASCPEDNYDNHISGFAGVGLDDEWGTGDEVPVDDTEIHANEIQNFMFGIGMLGGNNNVFGSAQYLDDNSGAYEAGDMEYDNYVHNNFAGIAAAGVEGGSVFGGGLSMTVGNYIGRNFIEDNYVGVGLIGAQETTIEGNKIVGGPAGFVKVYAAQEEGSKSIDFNESFLGIGIVGIKELSIGEEPLLDVPANNNTILDNSITNNKGMGILLLGSGENDIGIDSTNEEINGNTITNNGTAGLGIIGVDNFKIVSPGENPIELTAKLPANDNRIFGNDIQDNNSKDNNDGMGILLLGSSGNQIGGVDVEWKNTINNNGVAGLGIIGVDNFSIDISDSGNTLPEDAPTSLLSTQLAANDNDILGNEINYNSGMGVWLFGSGDNDIEGNEITGNGSAGISVAGIDEISVDITELVWNIIESIEGGPPPNDIKNNITFPGVINLSTNNNDILGNDITDNDGMGIWLLGSGENNIGWDYRNGAIKGNTITGNELAGIGIVGADEISIDAAKILEDIVTSVIDGLPTDMPVSEDDIDSFIPDDLIASVKLPANGNKVFGNTISNNGAFGIGLLGSSGNKIKYNEAIDDNFIGIGALGVNKLSYLKQILEEAQPSISMDELGDSFFESFGPLTAFFESPLNIEGLSSIDEVLKSLEIPGVLDLIEAGLEDEPFTCESDDNTISYNFIRGNEAVGIGLLNSNENVIKYNNITNTTKGGNLSSGKLPGFKDKDIPGTGIVISDADNNEIRYNVIRDNEVGVYLVENLIKDNYFENPGTPEGNSAHYNSIAGNENYGVLNETTETFNATLNWWGDHSGPYHQTENPDGTGNKVSDSVIFSPWIGMEPDENPNTVGVQLTSPLTLVVDDAGPAPDAGYLNTAVEAANSDELPGSDTIEVHNGDYKTSSDHPVTENVTIVSCMGCPMDASIDGELSITAEKVQIGGLDNYTAKGFNIDGDVRVEGDIDASTVHINWNNISGTVTNAANGTLDATYNWWGDPDGPTADEAAGSMEGDVDYTPFLSMKVCALMEYMEEHNIDDPKDAVAGMVAEDLTPCELTTAQLTGMGFSPDEAEELCEDYGCGRVMNAVEQADTSGEFVELLGGYSLPAGAAGGLTNNTVAGGAGSIGGKTIGSVFEVCDLIKINFALADFKGDPAKHLTPTVSLVKLDDDGEKESLERVTTASYKDPEEAYQATFSSCELPPGYYQAQVDLRDGSSLSQVIKIESDRAEKVEEA